MLTHIVCWKYKPDVSDDVRNDHIAMLRALTGVIPEIVSFSVGSDILHLDRSFDTGLVAVFENEAGLEAYTVHPDHQKVAALGKEIAAQVVSVDFIG